MLNRNILLSYLVLGIFIYDVFLKILIYYSFSYFEFDLNKNILTVVSFLILSFIMVFEIRRNKKEYTGYLIFVYFIIYMIAYIVYHSFFGKLYITHEVIYFQLKLILYYIYYMMLAILLYKIFETRYLREILIILFLCFVSFIFMHINLESLKFQMPYIRGAHHIVGTPFLVLSLLLMIFIEKKYLKIFFMSFLFLVLFIIKSRAIFYSFAVVYFIYLIKELGLKKVFYLSLVCISGVIILLYFDIINIDKRMLGLHKITQDGSFNERLEQFKYGIEAIKQNWFWGEFAGQVIVHEHGYKSGIMSAYMHNILSFWRQYGFALFICFSLLYYYKLYQTFFLWIQNKNNKKIQFTFFIGLYHGILLLFFQGYNEPLIWFSLALMFICVRDNIYNDVKQFL